jgi:hypothetical protein
MGGGATLPPLSLKANLERVSSMDSHRLEHETQSLKQAKIKSLFLASILFTTTLHGQQSTASAGVQFKRKLEGSK